MGLDDNPTIERTSILGEACNPTTGNSVMVELMMVISALG